MTPLNPPEETFDALILTHGTDDFYGKVPGWTGQVDRLIFDLQRSGIVVVKHEIRVTEAGRELWVTTRKGTGK